MSDDAMSRLAAAEARDLDEKQDDDNQEEDLGGHEPGVYRTAETNEQKRKCRFYRQRYPDVETLVMVNVKQVENLGAYVALLEYNDIEGMVLLSELSRRRIRSINKLIRVNRKEVVLVLRVDKEKGYVDLSKRRVPAEDVAKFTVRYNKSKTVHSILFNVASVCNVWLEDLYYNIAWPLYEKYGHAYDAFKLSISQPDKVFEGLPVPDNIRACLMKNVGRKLAAKAIKVRTDIECTCFTIEGIDAIKDSLLAAKAHAKAAGFDVAIKLIAPPLYVMTVQLLDKKEGISLLEACNEVTQKMLRSKGGRMSVKQPPHATNEDADAELEEQMMALARANQEVDGDADQ